MLLNVLINLSYTAYEYGDMLIFSTRFMQTAYVCTFMAEKKMQKDFGVLRRNRHFRVKKTRAS